MIVELNSLRAVWNRFGDKFLIVSVFIFALLFCGYHLTESPLTWRDEGVIIQVAKNLAQYGVYGVQIAPGDFVSAGFVTTGFPVIYPVALAFTFFGTTLFVARSVMVLFILGLLFLLYQLVLLAADRRQALVGIALAASFAPLYGHGKNVLGEIPGVFFLISGLVAFVSAQRGGQKKSLFCFLSGTLLGLSMSTKPIFLLLISPVLFLFVAVGLYRRQVSGLMLSSFLGGVILPVVYWMHVQFTNDTLASILSIYSGNPEGSSVVLLLGSNLRRFFTEFQPLYFGVTLGLWCMSIWIRYRNKIEVSVAELGAALFSLLVAVAFLKSVGYYRYFFPGQILSIAFLPASLSVIFGSFQKSFLQRAKSLGLTLLVVFQVYMTLFHSWVNIDFYGDRTAKLESYFRTVSPETILYFYDLPEAAFFAGTDRYFQYLHFASTIRRGQETISKISQLVPDRVVVSGSGWVNDPLFAGYTEVLVMDQYRVLARRTP